MISYHRKCTDFFNELKLDKRFLIDINQPADVYLAEAARVLNDASVFKFEADYGYRSLNHFKING